MAENCQYHRLPSTSGRKVSTQIGKGGAISFVCSPNLSAELNRILFLNFAYPSSPRSRRTRSSALFKQLTPHSLSVAQLQNQTARPSCRTTASITTYNPPST